jgi:phospholipid-binding lipoprotein MlaA
VALGYRETVPQFGRNRVSDVLANVKTPLIFANDLLQGDFKRAGRTLGRFVLNTTFGVGGIMDVATPMGIPRHESDFGETLGVWGVPEGPYLFIPLLGPSNVRDMTGSVAQSFADPLQIYLDDNGMWWVALTWAGVSAVSTREAYLDSLDELKQNSLDFYSALRSASRQRRQAQIAEEISGNDTPSAAVIRIFPRIQWNF